jgi:hypothetical protein
VYYNLLNQNFYPTINCEPQFVSLSMKNTFIDNLIFYSDPWLKERDSWKLHFIEVMMKNDNVKNNVTEKILNLDKKRVQRIIDNWAFASNFNYNIYPRNFIFDLTNTTEVLQKVEDNLDYIETQEIEF